MIPVTVTIENSIRLGMGGIAKNSDSNVIGSSKVFNFNLMMVRVLVVLFPL